MSNTMPETAILKGSPQAAKCCLIRTPMLVLNHLVLFFSGIQIVLSLYFMTSFVEITNDELQFCCIFGLINGTVLCVFALLSYAVVIRPGIRTLTTYATILILIALMCVIEASIAFNFVFNSDYTNIRTKMKYLFRVYHMCGTSERKVDKLQSYLKCCGIDGESNWISGVPKSCCDNESCTKIFRRGCISTLIEFFEVRILIKGILSVANAILVVIVAVYTLHFVERNENQYS